MKAVHFVLLLSLPLAVAATEVQTGDTMEQVRASLGMPRGQAKVGDRQTLYFDRGQVELRAGAVTHVALLSDADYAVVEARRTKLQEENSRLDAEGEALKARKLADASFLGSPVAFQLAFWQDFSRRYPGVSVTEQLMMAHLSLAEQYNDRRAQDARLDELEARVNDAESRAEPASYSGYGYGGYGYGSYGYYGGYRARHPFNLMPVTYHLFNAPLPVVPPFNPYPNRTSHQTFNNSDNDRRDGRHSGSRGRM